MQKVNYRVIFLAPKMYSRVTLECKLLIIKNADHLFCILLMLYLMSFCFILANFLIVLLLPYMLPKWLCSENC